MNGGDPSHRLGAKAKEFFREGETWEQLVERNPMSPVPLVILDAFVDQLAQFLKELNEKHKELEKRLEAVESRISTR